MSTAIVEDMVDWFYGLPTTDVVSHDLVAKKIRDARITHKTKDVGKPITNGDVNRMVTMVRKELELGKRTTIINIRNHGYKLANPKELAMTTARWVKRSVMYADRTYRLVDITDRKMIPGALREVFGDTQNKVKALSTRGKRFVNSFVVYIENQKRKEIENGKEKKQITQSKVSKGKAGKGKRKGRKRS
jgi:DNA-binding winged helix-turn-helix (wHTH) protein